MRGPDLKPRKRRPKNFDKKAWSYLYTRRPDVRAKRNARRAQHREERRLSDRERYAMNKAERQAYNRTYYAKNRDRIRARQNVLNAEWTRRKNRAIRGWTEERMAEAIAAQDGRCAICRDPFVGEPNADHDHVAGVPRGLLCSRCNTGLGLFRDDPALLAEAIVYLKAHSAAVAA